MDINQANWQSQMDYSVNLLQETEKRLVEVRNQITDLTEKGGDPWDLQTKKIDLEDLLERVQGDIEYLNGTEPL